MNYYSDGKSKGVANVTYVRSSDAAKAFGEYHNRSLDERPMKIELMVNPSMILASNSAKNNTHKPKLGPKEGAGIQKKQGQNVGKKTPEKPKREPRPAKKVKKVVTNVDLDAEMDAYMADEVLLFLI